MQLPPTVIDREASREGLRVSLFERLQGSGIEPLLLDTQYRMHPGIALHPSKAFYGGRIRSGVEASDRPPLDGLRWPNADLPIAFLNVRGKEQTRLVGGSGVGAQSEADALDGALVDAEDETYPAAASAQATSYANPVEADAVCRLVNALVGRGELSDSSVGVITPYSAQANLLQQRRLGGGNVEVSSVDGFQGREKEAIIFSAVRCNDARSVGFLADQRRLNVAITRAKRGLVLVGDEQTLSASPVWRDYLRFLRKKGCVLSSVEELLPE